jgi:hypothetical protein
LRSSRKKTWASSCKRTRSVNTVICPQNVLKDEMVVQRKAIWNCN